MNRPQLRSLATRWYGSPRRARPSSSWIEMMGFPGRPHRSRGRASANARLQIVGFLRMFSARSIERTFTSTTSAPLRTLSVTSTPGAPEAQRRR